MNRAIAIKDVQLLRGVSLLRYLSTALTLLLIVCLFVGVQREAEFGKERAQAQRIDREVWMGQGERNPHSAAHFSRYAFRTSSPLAIVDPGISDFAGLAIWMEAHYQDPAEFRRAEDSGQLSRFLQLSPAALFLIAVPLLVFILQHASVAGERESGTLRQLLAAGAPARDIFWGKWFAGLRVSAPPFLALFVLGVGVAFIASPAPLLIDDWVRAAALFALYSAYLITCLSIALFVSALCNSRRQALMCLFGIWAAGMILLPRLAVDLARNLHPPADAREVATRLGDASDTYYKDKERRAQIERDVLQQYGVETIDELPIDYGAYVLQISEELSNPEFEAIYQELTDTEQAQAAVVRAFGSTTPFVAAATLSRAVAGTDLEAQYAFARTAETHRRQMIKMLNEDYMYNAGAQGYSYTADATLWAQFEDFHYSRPTLTQVLRVYALELLLLLLWLVASTALAYIAVQRVVRAETN